MKRRPALALAVALLSAGVAVPAAGAATREVCPSGCAYATIDAGVAAAAPGDTVAVGAGTYVEDVTIGKSISLVGASPATTTVSGPIGGGTSTIRVAAANVTVSGLTITREGNNPTDWNDPGANLIGVGVQTVGGATITGNVITGNRTGIDVNNSNGNAITANRVDDNRTGLIFRNTTDDQTVTHNWITDNWTVGVLFLDTTPVVGRAQGSAFTDNDISGNWYGQIVDRQTNPPVGANLKDFSGNWLGAVEPVITTANSAEPGYAAQIPVAFGGTATPPGGQPDVAGPSSANIDVTPLLRSGTDTGGAGFHGDHSALSVTAQGAQVGSAGRIQQGVALATSGGAVHVLAGDYPLSSAVAINKPLTLSGPNAGIDPSDPGDRLQPNPERGPEATLSVTGATRAITIGAPDVRVDGLRFTNSGASASNANEPLIGAGVNFGGAAPGVTINANLFAGISRMAVYFNGPTAMSGGYVWSNRVDQPTRPASGCAGAVAPSACGHQLFNLWRTSGLSFEDNVVLAQPGNGDRVRVLNVLGGSGIDIRENTIRNACVYTCINVSQETDEVEITRNDVVIDQGNAVLLFSTFTGGSVNVHDNTLTATGDHAIVIDGATTDLSEVSLSRNAMTGGGVRNAAAQTADASCNWWGHSTGAQPAQNTGAVTARPYLRTPNLASTCAGADLTPTTWAFGDVARGQRSAPKTFTVTNTGAVPLVIGSISRMGAGASLFAVADDTCTAGPVAIGATCSFAVTFSPAAVGSWAPQVVVESNAGALMVDVSGSGIAPFGLDPAALSFGSVVAGEASAPQTVTVTNNGAAPLQVGAITKSGTGGSLFAVSADTCTGQSVAQGATCSFAVTFSPAVVGGWAPKVVVQSNLGTETIDVEGSGIAPVSVSPASFAFGGVVRRTASAPQTFTVTNNSSTPMQVASVAKSGTGGSLFAVSANTCTGQTIAAGATCSFAVTFTPTAVGSWAPKVVITSNLPTATVDVSGSGI